MMTTADQTESGAAATGRSWRFGPWLRGNITALSIGLLLCALYSHFFAFRAQVEVDVETFHGTKTVFKVYWAKPGQGYHESRSNNVRINMAATHYRMFLGALGGVERLRIDPIEYAGHVRLARIRISQPGYAAVDLAGEALFARLRPGNEVSRYELEPEGTVLLTTVGLDGQLEMDLALQARAGFHGKYLLHLALIMALALLLGRAAAPGLRDAAWVPWCLLVALVLALVMASISRQSAHPDEGIHAKVVDYYASYWLPPAADAPEARSTYSHYGTSRANNFELYYVVAGYFSRLMAVFDLHAMFDGRILGLAMFAAILWLTIRSPDFALVAVPLLVTAQAWYLFSYANSEGYALFLCMVMAWMAVSPTSPFNRFLSEEAPQRFWLTGIGLGVLVGLLFLIKVNFYAFILFLGCYFLWRLGRGDFPRRGRLWLRLGLVLVVALAVYGLRFGWDYHVNGPDSRQKIADIQNEYAIDVYKAETPLHLMHYNRQLKQKGVTVSEMIHKWRWGGKVYITAFGGYGHTEFMASDSYYKVVRGVGLLLVLVLLGSVLINGPPSMWVLSAVTVAMTAVVILAAFMLAWTNNFQAQGRYLAPVLPMLGVYYYHARPYLWKRLADVLVLALFVLAVYSFVFVGLADIPKFNYMLK